MCNTSRNTPGKICSCKFSKTWFYCTRGVKIKRRRSFMLKKPHGIPVLLSFLHSNIEVCRCKLIKKKCQGALILLQVPVLVT